MSGELNLPQPLAELTAASDRYEAALVANEVPVLGELFWNSPHAVRYGAAENLYGYAEIEAFRKSRPPSGLAREVVRREIVTFGTDTGAVNLEFRREGQGEPRIGRQSQLWRKFPEGWRITSAHVSLIAA
jgi:hypothetical protein